MVTLDPRSGVLWRCGILAAALLYPVEADSREASRIQRLARLTRKELESLGVPVMTGRDALAAVMESPTLDDPREGRK